VFVASACKITGCKALRATRKSTALQSLLLVTVALKFGPAEICSLMLLGLLAGSTLARGSPLKGVAITVVGLLIGIDRERKKGEGPARHAAGLRTFTPDGSPGSGGLGTGGVQPSGGRLGTGGTSAAGGATDGGAGTDGGAVDRADAQSPDPAADGPSASIDAAEAGESVGPMLKLVAGAVGGQGMQDGTGPVARFYDPLGVASDGNGHLFVADQFNHTIRRMVLATGAVTTVAGLPGTVGTDDGLGTGARFSLLPPDNASGNFVKVVQRVPVRIAWTKRPDVPLQAGLSTDVTVYVRKEN